MDGTGSTRALRRGTERGDTSQGDSIHAIKSQQWEPKARPEQGSNKGPWKRNQSLRNQGPNTYSPPVDRQTHRVNTVPNYYNYLNANADQKQVPNSVPYGHLEHVQVHGDRGDGRTEEDEVLAWPPETQPSPNKTCNRVIKICNPGRHLDHLERERSPPPLQEEQEE
ncbi:hypothetical protein NDU88_004412 [Pleurodeles waltl]|uniref:Uncharacterized protein n=1 Tax=Pleurodeles waltl TaxID=8319 RepID=A0AAV7VKN6_PLEWA|nr:hypothetical protein NDU88_004412 [Pleurodeles waltl]